jgi:hypothetical protein
LYLCKVPYEVPVNYLVTHSQFHNIDLFLHLHVVHVNFKQFFQHVPQHHWVQEFHFLYIFNFLVFRNLTDLSFKFWLYVVTTTRTEESYLLLLVQITLVEIISKASVGRGFEFQLD